MDDLNLLTPELSDDLWQRIFSFLDEDDLLSVSAVSKAFKKDVQDVYLLVAGRSFSTALHDQSSHVFQMPIEQVTGVELVLDSLACLLWVGDKKSICTAVALVGASGGGKRAKVQPRLVITANIAQATPSKGIKLVDEGFEIIDTKAVSGFEKEATAWLKYTAMMSIRKLGLPKELARALVDVDLGAVNPKFTAPEKRFEKAINTRRYCHAELKILDLLWAGVITPLPPETFGLTGDRGIVYIGVNLLCCQHCYKAIRAFNACSSTCQIIVRGSHGVGYKPVSPTSKESGWVPPFCVMLDPDIMRAFLIQYEDEGTGFRATKPTDSDTAIRPKMP